MCISKTPSTTLLQISTRKICFPRIHPPFFTTGLSLVSYNYFVLVRIYVFACGSLSYSIPPSAILKIGQGTIISGNKFTHNTISP